MAGIHMPLATHREVVVFLSGANVDLRTQAIAAGWDLSCVVRAIVNGNVTATAGNNALTVSGSFPQGVFLTVNAGVTVTGATGASGTNGASGAGAPFNDGDITGGPASAGSSGGPAGDGVGGGVALAVSVPITIDNQGTITGGSGGAAGTQSGGGGGNGLARFTATPGGYGNGGAGGNGFSVASGAATGGGAGTQLGTSTNRVQGGNGGNGGASGSAGQAGYGGGTGAAAVGTDIPGGGGAGGAGGAAGSAGSQGNAVTGNSNINWTNTGTRNGPIA